MKCTIIIGLGWLAASTFAHADTKPVEYVKVCSLYGAGYYYIPGTDTCYQSETGLTKRQTELGTLTVESDLSSRVTALEAQIQQLYEQFGNPKTITHTQTLVGGSSNERM